MKTIDWLESLLTAIIFNFLVWLSFVENLYFFEIILYVLITLSFIGLCVPSVFEIKRTITSELIGYISSIIAWYIAINNGSLTFANLLIIWYFIYFIMILDKNSKETTDHE